MYVCWIVLNFFADNNIYLLDLDYLLLTVIITYRLLLLVFITYILLLLAVVIYVDNHFHMSVITGQKCLAWHIVSEIQLEEIWLANPKEEWVERSSLIGQHLRPLWLAEAGKKWPQLVLVDYLEAHHMLQAITWLTSEWNIVIFGWHSEETMQYTEQE